MSQDFDKAQAFYEKMMPHEYDALEIGDRVEILTDIYHGMENYSEKNARVVEVMPYDCSYGYRVKCGMRELAFLEHEIKKIKE